MYKPQDFEDDYSYNGRELTAAIIAIISIIALGWICAVSIGDSLTESQASVDGVVLYLDGGN